MAYVKFLKSGLAPDEFIQHSASSDSLQILTLELTEATNAPLVINSTALVANLNVQYLNGKQSTDFLLLDGSQAMAGSLNLNNNTIINLADPVNDLDAANKRFVLSVAQGMDWKDSVRVASTADIGGTYSATGGTAGTGAFTGAALVIDGITLAVGDRVLLKDQSDATQNGIYVVTAVDTTNGVADLERAADMDGNPGSEVSLGNTAYVEEGTANGGNSYIVTGTDSDGDGQIDLNSEPINWTQNSGAGQIIAGAGLSKTGNQLDVVVDGVTIEVSGTNALQVKDGGITAAKIGLDAVNDTHIDFGTGTNQVNAEDIPIIDANDKFTATDVEGALSELKDDVASVSAEAYKTIVGTDGNSVIADQAADTLTFSSSDLTVAADDTTDTLTLSLNNGVITASHLSSNIDASSIGFNAATVDGKAASDLLLLDGSQAMTGDLDMGGYSIKNVANGSISFSDGSIITSSRFDTSGNIDATTLEGAAFDATTLVPKSTSIFSSLQVAKRIDQFARNFRLAAIVADDTDLSGVTGVEGKQIMVDPGASTPPTGFSAGDLIEYRNGAWTLIGNIADTPFVGSFLYIIDSDELYVVKNGGDIDKITAIMDTGADHVSLDNTNNTFTTQYLQDPNDISAGALIEAAAKNVVHMTIETGVSIPSGSPVYINSNGNIDLADNVQANGKYRVVGLARPGADTSHANVVMSGIFTSTDFLSGIGVAGDKIYLGASGTLTATAPSTAGDVVKTIGIKLNDSTMLVQIGPSVILS